MTVTVAVLPKKMRDYFIIKCAIRTTNVPVLSSTTAIEDGDTPVGKNITRALEMSVQNWCAARQNRV